jgi:hypothetical protein
MKQQPKMIQVDCTNSKLKGTVQIDELNQLTDFSAAHSSLKLEILSKVPTKLQTLDFSYTETSFVIDDVLSQIKKSQVKILGLKGNQISGFQPNVDDLQQFFVADLDLNPMMCKHDSRSMGDCVFMQLKGITNLQDKLEVQFTSSKRLKSLTDDVMKHLTLFVKDYAKSNVNTTEVNELKGCVGKVLYNYLYSLECDNSIKIKNITDVAIAYKGKQVSTGALMIVKEIREMLEETKTMNYFERSGRTAFE